MTIPDGVTKLTIFEAFEDDQDSKWRLAVVGEGFFLCETLEPLWNIFIEGYELAQRNGKPGVAMLIHYPADHEKLGATLCSFRQFPDRLVPNRIEKGREVYELEQKLRADKTNVAKVENDYGLEIIEPF